MRAIAFAALLEVIVSVNLLLEIKLSLSLFHADLLSRSSVSPENLPDSS